MKITLKNKKSGQTITVAAPTPARLQALKDEGWERVQATVVKVAEAAKS